MPTVRGALRRLDPRRLTRRRQPPTPMHRVAVGSGWEEIGRHQFDWLVGDGLRPVDVLLDIGCGSLRGGRLFIEYLEPGHYLGIDHQAWLIEAGLEHELPREVRAGKRPRFVVSDDFEFERFGDVSPDRALAQSVFSHLVPDDIRRCLRKLRPFIADSGLLNATYIPRGTMPAGYRNPSESDDWVAFEYAPEEIAAIGEETGWRVRDIGDWGHPRGQQMMELRPA